MNSNERFTLVAGHWYAWHLWPGDVAPSLPYCSPIRVQWLQPGEDGTRRLAFAFYNAGYAEGVRDFHVQLRVLHRTPTHLLGALIEPERQRSVVISPLDADWIDRFAPALWAQAPRAWGADAAAQARANVLALLDAVFGFRR